MKKLLTLIFIIFFLTTCVFEQASESSYSDLQKADASNLGVDLPEAGYNRKYCATLESIALAGDFETGTGKDPELYGRVCTSTSQDKLLLNNKLDLNSRLSACKDLWREYDDNVFAASWIVSLVSRVTDIFDNANLQAISKMYQGAKSPPKLKTNFNHLILKGQTLSLSDYKNHRLIVIFLPIIDDDSIRDEVLIDSHDIKNRDHKDDYPIIVQALPSELPSFGDKIYKTQTLEDSKHGGKATFTLSFKTGACD